MSDAAAKDVITKRRRGVWVVVGLLLLLVAMPVVYVAVRLANPLAIPQVTMPNPNGYDALVAAGERLGDSNAYEVKEQGADAYGEFVENYGQILDDARAAIQLESRVPVRYSAAADFSRLDQMGGLRELSRALVVEARWHQAEGRHDEALAAYVDTLRYGQRVRHGGLLMDELVGVACEGLAIEEMRSLGRELLGECSAKALREAMDEVAAIEQERESLDDVMYRERVFAERASGLMLRMWVMWYGAEGFPGTREGMQALEETFERSTRAERRTLVELAVACYLKEQGELPGELAVLVPDYLEEVPVDPATGVAPRYVRVGEEWFRVEMAEVEQ